MARISGVDIPKQKRGVIALTYIFGIGRTRAKKILESAKVSEDKKVSDWNDDDTAKVREAVGTFKIEGELRSENQINIKRLMDIGTNDIYNAFKLCSFKDTKVVILGQDPYHQKGVANGLAFSVNKGKKIPASLRNIYKEIHSDLGVVTHHSGDLSSWARQGVLLINFSLTVEDSKPGSHFSIGWSNVVESVIEILNKKHNLVYLLWGANSISKRHLINETRHVVFTAPHPSPLSAYRGFLGCPKPDLTSRLPACSMQNISTRCMQAGGPSLP